MKKNGFIAWLLIVIILLGSLVSMNFLIENAHHHCSGQHCGVCMEMEQASEFINNLKVMYILSVVLTVLCVSSQTSLVKSVFCFHKDTLISLKVELLN